jgi:hypothetical protein
LTHRFTPFLSSLSTVLSAGTCLCRPRDAPCVSASTVPNSAATVFPGSCCVNRQRAASLAPAARRSPGAARAFAGPGGILSQRIARSREGRHSWTSKS